MNGWKKAVFYGVAAVPGAFLDAPVDAALLAEERFLTGSTPSAGEYDASLDLGGQSPTATGFTGAWSASSTGQQDVSEAGLSYGSLDTAGGSVYLDNHRDVLRSLAFTIDNDANRTYYVSLLMQTSTLGPASHDFNRFVLNGTQRSVSVGYLGGDYVLEAQHNNGTWRQANLGDADTETNLFVIKLELSSTGLGDVITVYRNPSDLSSEAGNTAAGTITDFNLRWDVNAIGMDMDYPNAGAFDEIRIGDTWGDVMPVPEPASLGLLGVGGMMLLPRRRG